MEDVKVTATGYDFRPAHAAMQRYVDGNFLSGFSSAVLVGRELADVKCIGWADKEAQIPLRVDHIFRMFSNTKLITSCAALLLFEEGHFQLDDPIEQFIPQLANCRVLYRDATSLDQTEPAVRSITIRHLMSHTSGLSYGLFEPGTLIFNAYNERKVINPATTLAEMMDVLADLPLIYHPGTSWEYSVIDVLARLVEVISGQRFDAFIQSRILGPLGMVDTGFVVSDRNRLVAYYAGAARFIRWFYNIRIRECRRGRSGTTEGRRRRRTRRRGVPPWWRPPPAGECSDCWLRCARTTPRGGDALLRTTPETKAAHWSLERCPMSRIRFFNQGGLPEFSSIPAS